MAFVFHRGVAIPIWAIALCAIALTSESSPLSVTALLAIAAIGSFVGISRWLGRSRPFSEGPRLPSPGTRPAGLIVNVVTKGKSLPSPRPLTTEETNDVLDLVRMDDDGGWRQLKTT